MKIGDLLEIIWNNMWRRRTRTILTMLGVVIGSIAIFVIVSIGNGFQTFLGNQLSSFGDSNVINVLPYNSAYSKDGKDLKNKKLVLNDKALKELNKLEGVKYCVPKISSNGTIKYKKNEMPSALIGMEMKEYSKDHKLFSGKFPSDEAEECVIGNKIAKYLINAKEPDKVKDEEINNLVRKKIQFSFSRTLEDGTIENKEYTFRVSGISVESTADDFSVKMPIKALKSINQWKLEGKGENSSTYQQIDVVVNDAKKIGQLQKEINNNGYMASSLKEIQDGLNKTLSGVKLILGAIGAISLLVAAFGIANTMNMSIYERKKEIGVMKVIGAGLFDIKKIFIGEASAIGFIGGLTGVILGFMVNFIVNSILKGYLSKDASNGDVKIATANIGLVLFVLLFSSLIGFLSGIYPASKAAKLNVINSIKDE